MDLSSRSKSRFFDSGIYLRRKGILVFLFKDRLLRRIIICFDRVLLSRYFVIHQFTYMNRWIEVNVDRGVAINEAITNVEDKLESNKAVKMISGPKHISIWIWANLMPFTLTYKWVSKWTDRRLFRRSNILLYRS